MRELALVMPIYNEESCIAGVVQSWIDQLSQLEIDFVMILLNDGSRDDTEGILRQFSAHDRVSVINKENSGHGPTILLGYSMAVRQAKWVFQTDSDDEIKSEHFDKLWNHRCEHDALFGYRGGRKQGLGRKIITGVCWAMVHTLFGKGVIDVNTPFRLVRSSILSPIIDRIPTDTFAPNVLISGVLVGEGARIYNHCVPHEGRRTGTVSIVRWKLWKAASKSFMQSIRFKLSKPQKKDHQCRNVVS